MNQGEVRGKCEVSGRRRWRHPGGFKPALSYRLLTGLYDPVVRWTTNERAFRAILARQTSRAAPKGARVLDLGCGTGTFALDLGRRRPDLAIVGLDADEAALAIARRKGESIRSSVVWQSGRAERLPYADETFGIVTSSFFFHHLRPEAKVEVAREIWRVLVPGGEVHVADWTTPQSLWSSLGFLLVQLLDGFATTREHRRGQLAMRFAEARFVDVESTAMLDVLLGTIGFWRARREAAPAQLSSWGEP